MTIDHVLSKLFFQIKLRETDIQPIDVITNMALIIISSLSLFFLKITVSLPIILYNICLYVYRSARMEADASPSPTENNTETPILPTAATSPAAAPPLLFKEEEVAALIKQTSDHAMHPSPSTDLTDKPVISTIAAPRPLDALDMPKKEQEEAIDFILKNLDITPLQVMRLLRHRDIFTKPEKCLMPMHTLKYLQRVLEVPERKNRLKKILTLTFVGAKYANEAGKNLQIWQQKNSMQFTALFTDFCQRFNLRFELMSQLRQKNKWEEFFNELVKQ